MAIRSLGVDERLVKAVTELGFTQPTEIQSKAIPLLLNGDRDLIGLAQTGTGKTAAFGLPMIQSIDVTNGDTQALVMCPTRELCLQITHELTQYAKYIDGINIVAVYGGASINDQIKKLRRGAHIVVGTPGRLLDHISRRTVGLANITRVVLDEADQMLDMGFHEDIDSILSTTPATKKTWLFSATMQGKIEKIAHKYMTNPIEITVGSRNSGARNIEHQYCVVKRADTHLVIKRFIDFYPGMFGIVFCRTRKDTQELSAKLAKDGYNADALHGDLSQEQRDVVMNKFRNRQIQVLIATDVAARGIDVDDITHVMHCDLPDDVENYTHRSGRTARAGKSGVSIIISSPGAVSRIRYVERQIGQAIAQVQVPNGSAICQKQLAHFSSSLVASVPADSIVKPYLESVSKILINLSREELIERMLSITCSKMLQRYAQAPDINVDSRSGSGRDFNDRRSNDRGGDYRDDRRSNDRRSDDRRSSGSDRRSNDRGTKDFSDRRTSDYNSGGPKYSRGASSSASSANRLFINVGKIDGLDKGSFIKFVCGTSSVDSASVGQIVMQNTRSFFSVDDSKSASMIVDKLKDASFKGRRVRIELTEDRPERSDRY
jgi:ATP-dependent RNA helicase DeaD